jgi:malonyl-CoA/methylmalonyl-CoA synthetase
MTRILPVAGGSARSPAVAQNRPVPPSPDDPLYESLLGVAAADPGCPCLVTPGDGGADGTWSYGDLDRRAAALAGALTSVGVEVGDRVVVQVDKSPDAVALYLGCLRIGAVYVPLNTAYTPSEVALLLEDAGAALFVGRPGSPAPPLPSGCAVRKMDVDGSGSLGEEAETAEPAAVEPRHGSDPAAMLYTSGTTGRPKGAVLSCRNLVANARALVHAWRFGPDDVLLHVLPVFHVHGLFVALHCAFVTGATVRLHPRFDVAAVRRDLARSTVMMGVPTHYHRLLADPAFGAGDCAGVRLFTSGSAPLPAADHEEFSSRTGHRIVERYGMTETMILTSNPYDGDRVAGTVGFPLDGVDLRVVGEDGRSVARGAPGTVEVRGDGVFLGYWGQPDVTAAAHRADGWFVTGDVGSLDGDGRLTLLGRQSDMIITGGLNVYPSEIEAVLDSVDGVVESAVVGVTDPDLGEAVVAVVVTEPGASFDEERAAGACAGRLARFKHPRRYVVVDDLPRNAMGKVQKAELRRMLGGVS